MRPRLAIILALIVMVPLGLLLWIGIDGVRREREVARQRTQELFDGKLQEAASRILSLLRGRERELARAVEGLSPDPATLREWLRKTPFVSQVFVLGPDRKRVHPPPDGPCSSGEREFLERAGQLWRDAQAFFRQPEAGPPPPPPSRDRAPAAEVSVPSSGWYSWFWGNGLNLVFWERLESGIVYGFELDRTRFLSDAVVRLLSADPPPSEARLQLVDSRGETLCLWGSYEPVEGQRPGSQKTLDHPLGSWRLDYFHNPSLSEESSRRMIAQLVAGLSAAGVLIAGLAIYFWRESSRELREAAQRVTCLNQVSHELKTPLTNIRMYSELLQEKIPAEDEKASRSIDIIVSESQRLSRLIANILTFSRKRQHKLSLHRRPGVIDQAVQSAIAHWRPTLAAKGIEVSFEAGAPREVTFDPDALEQILGNLFSNVEKYAPGNGAIEVRSSQDDTVTTLTVADRGPGIPWRYREEIFKPFRRLRSELTEGVSGSGLGLSIARDLARLHGGDLRLLQSERGARFEVVLSTPRSAP